VLVLLFVLVQVCTPLEQQGSLAIAPQDKSTTSSWENGNSAGLSAHFERGHTQTLAGNSDSSTA